MISSNKMIIEIAILYALLPVAINSAALQKNSDIALGSPNNSEVHSEIKTDEEYSINTFFQNLQLRSDYFFSQLRIILTSRLDYPFKEKAVIDLIKQHINSGYSINITDARDNTPLHFTAAHFFYDATKLLIDHNALINSQNCDHCTPLHLLLKNPLNPNLFDKFHQYAYTETVTLFQENLTFPYSSFDSVERHKGFISLKDQGRKNRRYAIEHAILLEKTSPKINLPERREQSLQIFENTYAINAKFKALIKIEQLLLEKGASTEIVNTIGASPYDYAKSSGNRDIVKIIESFDQDNEKNKLEIWLTSSPPLEAKLLP